MTPADCTWHLPQEVLQRFADSKEAGLLKQAVSAESKKEQLAIQLQNNADYQTLMKVLSRKRRSGLGFPTIRAVTNQQNALQECTIRSRNAKTFTDLQSILEGRSHVKGKMFQFLIKP